MQTEIFYRPANTAAKITFQQGETFTAEAGSMIAMSKNVSITTSTHKKGKGSLLKAVKRLLAGESFFLNHYAVEGGDGEVWLAPVLSGDLLSHELNGETLIVQSGSFLACEDSISIDVGWQGFKNIFSGESLFWLQLSGKGTTILNAFGAIYPVEVSGEYIVDTGHIVAFQETLNYTLSKAGKSWFSSILGGEGIICHFKGQGTVWCQSHNPESFGRSLTPFLKPRQG